MPLIRGHYNATSPLWSLTGATPNVVNGVVPARTNLSWFGLGNPSDGALASTGVSCSVPIPVEYGDIITKVTVLIGATAASTPTHQFVAVYSGIATPALMAQSTSTTTAAIAASAASTWTLATAQIITPANAPFGFVYATVCITASTICTAASLAIPTAVGYQWFTNGPLFLSATHGSAQAGTAAATIASPSAKAVAPVVFLT